VVIENRFLRAVVIPALGGRVWELADRIRGRQWLWHRPDVPLRAVPAGSAYDDVWAGGWEELFPNDAPGSFEGRELPDHGEWWTLPFNVTTIVTGTQASLVLESRSSAVKAACVKEFVLAEDAPTLTVNYRIRSQESRVFHFLFKQHLPIEITPGCRLSLPGGQVTPVDSEFSTLLPSAASFQWPFAATSVGTVDLRRVPPPSSKLQEFVYVQGLPDGWCAVHDEERSASLTMNFDRKVMPYVWLFLSYGGWRDLYTAVLEPCSNMPKDLASAVRLGQSARLDAGQEFATCVSVTLGGLTDENVESCSLRAGVTA
jgi:hypothetical protein